MSLVLNHMQCLTLFLFYFKLEDNYCVVLVSPRHQHESTTGIHMSLLSWTSLPPTSHLSYPSTLSSWLSVFLSFVYVFLLLSPFIPPSPSPSPYVYVCIQYIFLIIHLLMDTQVGSISQLANIKSTDFFFLIHLFLFGG